MSARLLVIGPGGACEVDLSRDVTTLGSAGTDKTLPGVAGERFVVVKQAGGLLVQSLAPLGETLALQAGRPLRLGAWTFVDLAQRQAAPPPQAVPVPRARASSSGRAKQASARSAQPSARVPRRRRLYAVPGLMKQRLRRIGLPPWALILVGVGIGSGTAGVGAFAAVLALRGDDPKLASAPAPASVLPAQSPVSAQPPVSAQSPVEASSSPQVRARRLRPQPSPSVSPAVAAEPRLAGLRIEAPLRLGVGEEGVLMASIGGEGDPPRGAWAWSLVERPEGSSSELVIDRGRAVLRPDHAGRYLVAVQLGRDVAQAQVWVEEAALAAAPQAEEAREPAPPSGDDLLISSTPSPELSPDLERRLREGDTEALLRDSAFYAGWLDMELSALGLVGAHCPTSTVLTCLSELRAGTITPPQVLARLVATPEWRRAHPAGERFGRALTERVLGLAPGDPDYTTQVLAAWRLFEGQQASFAGGSGDTASDAVTLATADPRAARAQAGRLLRFVQGAPASPSQLDALLEGMEQDAFRTALGLASAAIQAEVPGTFRSRAG